MADREKLIELIRKADKEDHESRTQDEHYGFMADYLIANGVKIQKWIPVSERLPELDELVVCYRKGKMFFGKYLGAMYSPVVGAFKSNEEYYALGATHWMPLPEPPKESE